jgi:hypothetical protein
MAGPAIEGKGCFAGRSGFAKQNQGDRGQGKGCFAGRSGFAKQNQTGHRGQRSRASMAGPAIEGKG